MVFLSIGAPIFTIDKRKKVYILAKYVNTERKFEIKAKTISACKGLFFGLSQIAWIFFLQNVHLITKYLLSEKIENEKNLTK